ncbi:bifunctional 3,4-dihydroxy-2-butanone-4-phosphate synthase/GTP cyclohydrolase II [Sporosarcina aquimarina]|uniref:Riboflavin biosynthesis protein RibBA n=1 Tax=Sporosarcina aquimarina TaxID=114975 RepID=A0ABU4G2H9_9BACL|nr:bifunctional 3,4-dihydroxy-2-butanone-4-phosphate synthase/GTP cyclohydrolase II [Sporosarcina aquimarina]MDW0111186.1 bifunctional 3,4-dihydroxy-2-butanone-4-phosphate synthase/GTP cyclohydrolase II [Sporosarcina aquimarina]
MFDTIDEAIQDLKLGKPIIVVDDENRENEGDFMCLAEHATPEMINFMATKGRGLICTPITESKASQLGLPMMTAHNTDAHGTAFTVSIDHSESYTGISAFERSETILKMLDAQAAPQDFKQPGHVFPLVAQNNGVLSRIGHTEASIDLARLAGSEPAAVICEIMSEDGSMARVPELRMLADSEGLKLISIEDLVHYRLANETLITRDAEVVLPTLFGQFKMIGYTEKMTGKEHVVLVKGDLSRPEPILVRVHSECLTGDIFGSSRCDCGPQLHAALQQIEDAGRGVLLYMRQEGRGIGLMNKLKAYELQEQGLDTVEANAALGFPDDLRDYGISAQILQDLGIIDMRLLTNNPRKLDGLVEHGLTITERVPIELPVLPENERYMATKVEKLGHLLTL